MAEKMIARPWTFQRKMALVLGAIPATFLCLPLYLFSIFLAMIVYGPMNSGDKLMRMAWITSSVLAAFGVVVIWLLPTYGPRQINKKPIVRRLAIWSGLSVMIIHLVGMAVMGYVMLENRQWIYAWGIVVLAGPAFIWSWYMPKLLKGRTY